MKEAILYISIGFFTTWITYENPTAGVALIVFLIATAWMLLGKK